MNFDLFENVLFDILIVFMKCFSYRVLFGDLRGEVLFVLVKSFDGIFCFFIEFCSEVLLVERFLWWKLFFLLGLLFLSFFLLYDLEFGSL